jgi:hypothetical protein
MVTRSQPLRFAGLAVLGAGIILTIAGAVMLMTQVRRIESWHAVTARVVRSFGDEKGVHYEFWYDVNGTSLTKPYSSTRGTPEQIRERAAVHIAGDLATVYYDPKDPYQIDPNLGYNANTLSGAVLSLGIGIASLLAGAALLLLARSAGSVL